MSNLSKFTQDYLSYRKPTETGGVSYVERLPAGSDKSGKTHHVLHFRKIVIGSTSPLVKHEEKILDGIVSSRIPHTVRFLDYQNSPNHQDPKKSSQTIVTEAAGVDLCDWFNAPIFINELNRSLDNIYDHPLFALTILKGSLIALEKIHQHNIIHCDIKLDNICLPFRGGDAGYGDTIQIQLDNITLIDFGVAYWAGNMGDHERIWLGYNENKEERYQSRFLINTLKQWYRDNNGRTASPYDNSSLTWLNYSCDLYGLGVAFEFFCQDQRYQQKECWSIVYSEVCSIINELKLYDNGIPNTELKPPHQSFIQRLDILIQKVVAYEKAKGFLISANYTNGRLLKHKSRPKTIPKFIPTPPVVDISNIGLSDSNAPTKKRPEPNLVEPPKSIDKKPWKKAWIGGGALLLAVAVGAMMTSNQENDVTVIDVEASEGVADASPGSDYIDQTERQEQSTHEAQDDQVLNDSALAVAAGQVLEAVIQSSQNTMPDLWTVEGSMGFFEYSLSNSQNQTIIITCNVAGSEEIDHSFSYYPNGWNPDGASPLTNIKMVLDDMKVVYPPMEGSLPTSTTNGGKNWVNFTTGISTATKIDIYSENDLIATFRPSPANVKEIASQLAECEPMQ